MPQAYLVLFNLLTGIRPDLSYISSELGDRTLPLSDCKAAGRITCENGWHILATMATGEVSASQMLSEVTLYFRVTQRMHGALGSSPDSVSEKQITL